MYLLTKKKASSKTPTCPLNICFCPLTYKSQNDTQLGVKLIEAQKTIKQMDEVGFQENLSGQTSSGDHVAQLKK